MIMVMSVNVPNKKAIAPQDALTMAKIGLGYI
jgi:hypothetical protein